MEQLKSVLTAACMLSLAIGLCNVIKPSRIFEKQVRFLISLLFVIGLASPLLQIDWQSSPLALAEDLQASQAEKLTQELQTQLLEETAVRTENALLEVLAADGVSCSELDVSVHIDDAQCIYISEVSVVCSDAEKANNILQASFGEEVTVHVTEMVP